MTSLKRIVVKIGSSLLTNNGRGLDRTAIYEWARQIAVLHARGIEVVLVSSGAVAEGVVRMNLPERPKKLAALQACASIGQMGLIETWWQALIQKGVQSSQILLTHDDLAHRSRYLNISQTVNQLVEWRVVPVINENDTVSYGEIKFGDNDTLGAMSATMVGADLYIILTDQEGVFTDNPRTNPNAKLIQSERAMADYLFDVAGDGGKWGSGGMLTKIRAARLAAMGNCPTIIANGKVENVITRLADGEVIGTRLTVDGADKLIAKKQWLASHIRMKGTLVVDAGAAGAIVDKQKSLLPVGVIDVQGDFDAGDVVEIVSPDKVRIAVGQAGFNAQDAKKITQQHTAEVLQILNLTDTDKAVMVHRDEMAVL
ncbi:glutamate 5-kinase [Moraxella caviae]|uniref:Glutamate 5-kinase n=1 Tax=Moraxella caviae TaxID=34060 RepID=A0A1T0A2E8_9GAMM|nr:glutamate 5-kinase [Moraxella caviae]OOR89923.1 glutamate 5-kinase [Moraxella caviae]STZ14306.1 Glutamate 5-kinase [Moraxella caviae]VEW12236.1 Glutamate 5-kinase [Moraxella caviae]